MGRRATAERRMAEQKEFIRDMKRRIEWDWDAYLSSTGEFEKCGWVVQRLIMAASIAGQRLTYDTLLVIMRRKKAIANLFGAPIEVISDPSFQSCNTIKRGITCVVTAKL